jgi:hypothetical protein
MASDSTLSNWKNQVPNQKVDVGMDTGCDP